MTVAPGADRFFDVETGGPLRLELVQHGARFKVLRQVGYRDPAYREPFIVPADPETFETDLASIPWMFAWLVPGMGTHLPAVLLHDGLVVSDGEAPTHLGPEVDREEADRILRDAMASLGTPRLRRWLMWAGVIMATGWAALHPRWRWRSLVVGGVGTIAVLGVLATLDLADIWDVLPWMDGRPWWQELAGGALFAVLVPLMLSVLWGRLWSSMAIVGIGLALLFHATLLLVVLYGIYWVIESVVSRPEGTRPNVRLGLAAAASREAGPATQAGAD